MVCIQIPFFFNITSHVGRIFLIPGVPLNAKLQTLPQVFKTSVSSSAPKNLLCLFTVYFVEVAVYQQLRGSGYISSSGRPALSHDAPQPSPRGGRQENSSENNTAPGQCLPPHAKSVTELLLQSNSVTSMTSLLPANSISCAHPSYCFHSLQLAF